MPDSTEAWTSRALVVSVIGPQNSGKTTLVSNMVAHWTSQGLRVGTIKHDGHAAVGQADDWEKADSDTVLHARAGAAFTMVAGGGQTLLRSIRDPVGDDPVALCTRLQRVAAEQGAPLDVVIVEGFKHSGLAKVVPLRREQDVAWLRREHFANVRAVVCSDACMSLADDSWAVYHEKDAARLCDALMDAHLQSLRQAPGGLRSEVK